QGDAGSSEPDAFAVEEAENAAGKVLRLADGVESARLAVPRVGVSRGEKPGHSHPVPVSINRKLQCRHLRVDVRPTPGNRVNVVVPQNFIDSVADIEPLDVPVPGPAEVMSAHIVRQHAAYGRRPYQESVVVKMHAGVIFVVVIAELRRVSLGK